MVFRQYSIARFMISFIVFILCYIAAGSFRDGFFQLLIAGLFVLTLFILREVKIGQDEILAQRDALWAEKIQELEERWRWESSNHSLGRVDSGSDAENDDSLPV